MSTWKWTLILFVIVCAGCSSPRDDSRALAPEQAAEIQREVREFASTVEHDVTKDGPVAWGKHFSKSPAFFMASEGHLQFPDGASATAGIQKVARTIKHIELKWSDVRVDPLTPELAQMGAGWHEMIELAEGKRLEDGGYFTGITEHRNGRWQFRNAHWSVAAPGKASP